MSFSEFLQGQNVGHSALHVPAEYCIAEGGATVVAHWDMLRAALKSLCALLNSPNGGEFFLGVRIDGVVEGIVNDYLPAEKLAEDAQLLFSHSNLMRPRLARDAYVLKFPVVRLLEEMDEFRYRPPKDCSARVAHTPNPSHRYLMKVEVPRPSPELQFLEGIAYRWEMDPARPDYTKIAQLPDCSQSIITFDNLLAAFDWGIENAEAAEQKESAEVSKRLAKLDWVLQQVDGQLAHFVERDAKRRAGGPHEAAPLASAYASQPPPQDSGSPSGSPAS